MLIIDNIVKIAISSSKRKANLRPVLLAKKLHVFATKTYYVHGFRYNFSNPVILFAKKCSVVEKENTEFLVIDPKVPFALAQMVLGRVNFALINPPFCGDKFLTDTR